MLTKARPIWLPSANPSILSGVVGLVILALWAVFSTAIWWIFKGVAFDD